MFYEVIQKIIVALGTFFIETQCMFTGTCYCLVHIFSLCEMRLHSYTSIIHDECRNHGMLSVSPFSIVHNSSGLSNVGHFFLF